MIEIGDCRQVMAAMDSNTIDAVVTDPPYSLGFMGKAWDSTGTANDLEVWARCLWVLKPGGYLLAFGGTRTYHRMVCAVEDANFEIRDSLIWVYSQGFPKGAGALKPSHEPIVLARKQLEGTIAANVVKWGTGALNVDGCRIGTDEKILSHTSSSGKGRSSTWGENNWADSYQKGNGREYRSGGRWPPNLILTHHPNCTDPAPCVDGCPSVEMNAQSGNNASRFFPTFRYQAKAPKSERPRVNGVSHPTVKPLALMRWLVRLVTPPGGVILDPFAGSGTTLEAAALEGFVGRGIESDPACLPWVEERLGRVELKDPELF